MAESANLTCVAAVNHVWVTFSVSQNLATKRREEAEAQAKRVIALREYARLSRLRFDNGAASYIEVLYAENELFSAELVAVSAQAEGYVQLIAVYQSVGGGWVDAADAIALPRKEEK